ncbi:unnamed protein product [Ambrosiozyma monospora]|uniref:Unnamed protein product n=1 Tax=Ambrosiozyma monospora TaxID=43982 RepID=A0ACB5UC28_AMBMO|nr:unnamed protein product [Ambrosiozyma monospora]
MLKLLLLEELEVRWCPFDIRGCPNLKKLTFSAFETSYLYSALKYIQQLSITELIIDEIGQYFEDEVEADEKPLELIIPSSVQRLSLLYRDAGSCNDYLPYVLLLPPVSESLVIKDLSVMLSNIHEVICFFEDFVFKISLDDSRNRFMEFKPTKHLLEHFEDACFRTCLDTHIYCTPDIPESVNKCRFLRQNLGKDSMAYHYPTPKPTKRMIETGMVKNACF